MTTSALSIVVTRSKPPSIGPTIEAVVTMATVEDPCAVLITAASTKGSARPKGSDFNNGSTLR